MDVITVQSVAKRYWRSRTGGPGRLQRLELPWRRDPHWALRDVTFTVGDGESVGLIGVNGSGKSTLLRLLSGTAQPTAGSIRRSRPVSGLLTLGDTFQAELSGRDNACTAALLGGLSAREARRRMPAIGEFAELSDVLDQPIRTYSDGMKLRLAFAVATSVDPQILLIDEILAVGDLRFRQRCLQRIEQMQAAGVTLVISSHELEQVEQLCQRAVWLADGRVMADGPAAQVTAHYRQVVKDRLAGMTTSEDGFTRIGDRSVEIVGVRVNGVDAGSVQVELAARAPVTVELDFVTRTEVVEPIFGVSIHTADAAVRCLDLTTAHSGVSAGTLRGRGTVRLELERLDLKAGAYRVDVGVFRADWQHPYDYHWAAYPIQVLGRPTDGLVSPPHTWHLEED